MSIMNNNLCSKQLELQDQVIKDLGLVRHTCTFSSPEDAAQNCDILMVMCVRGVRYHFSWHKSPRDAVDWYYNPNSGSWVDGWTVQSMHYLRTGKPLSGTQTGTPPEVRLP